MKIKALARLTRLLVVLLKIDIGLLIIAVLVGVFGWFEYSNLSSDVDANEMLLLSDVLNILVGFVQILLAVFLGVTFLRWIYRGNKNLHALSSEPMAWVVGRLVFHSNRQSFQALPSHVMGVWFRLMMNQALNTPFMLRIGRHTPIIRVTRRSNTRFAFLLSHRV